MLSRSNQHRSEHLRAHDYPFDRIISTGYDKDNCHYNRKRKIIEEFHHFVSVDDLSRILKILKVLIQNFSAWIVTFTIIRIDMTKFLMISNIQVLYNSLKTFLK
jgi:hypothetical protein